MDLVDMRREYEQLRHGWRTQPPAEHRFSLARAVDLRREADESVDEGTELLLVELDDLIAQIEATAPGGVRQPQSRFNEPSDAM